VICFVGGDSLKKRRRKIAFLDPEKKDVLIRRIQQVFKQYKSLLLSGYVVFK
jgi:hypothetical protein